MGVPITFSVPNIPSPGTNTYWKVDNGVIINGNPGKAISVAFISNPTGPYKVRARNQNGKSYSSWVEITVQPMEVDFRISGPVTVGSSTYETYSVDEIMGDKYIWTISPNFLGSVVNIDHKDRIKILWNNVSAPTIATVMVKVEKCGQVYFESFQVTVQQTPDSRKTISTTDCKQEELIIAPTRACVGTPVEFTLKNHNPNHTYLWSFGDAAFNSLPNTVRVFGNEGPYVVTLTITDQNGCQSVSSHTIRMEDATMEGYIMGPQQKYYKGDSITLLYASQNNISVPTLYHWNHKGTTTTNSTGMLTVTKPGEYVLDVENSHGCITKRIDNVFIEFFDPLPPPNNKEQQ